MTFHKTDLFIFIFLLSTLAFCPIEAKNWMKWFRSMAFVRREMMTQKPLGFVGQLPRGFNVLTDEIKVAPNVRQLINPTSNGPIQADIVFGRGMALKSFQADMMVHYKPVKKQENICGIVITSLAGFNSGLIDRMKIYWMTGKIPWDLIVNSRTGEDVFYPRLHSNKNSRVILFDSIPALHIRMLIIGVPGKNLNLKMALISNCVYRNTISIKDCGEKVDRNPKFASLPSQVPISIRCPVDCIRTWPCWGFKIYSSDSPICWTATQNFGHWGNGLYTMYKIPGVVYFRTEINPVTTHGVFCRRSTVHYSGYTFDKKYFDMAKKEYRDTMGA